MQSRLPIDGFDKGARTWAYPLDRLPAQPLRPQCGTLKVCLGETRTSELGRTQTLSAGHLVMPHNKALQLTVNPLRGFPQLSFGVSSH
jgi:hypothetical protein